MTAAEPSPDDGLTADLRGVIAAELDRPADPAARAMAAHLATRPGAAAVLFYGARSRAAARPDGVADAAPESASLGPLDFYLLTEGDRAYHGPGLAALANRLLPPNVYHEVLGAPALEANVEAKVAVMSLAAFRRRMDAHALDTTLWARFAQPAVLVWARGPAERAAVVEAVAAAVETAAWWAARLAPDPSDPGETWRALFRHTYGSELRVEAGGRAADLVGAAPARYRRLHALVIAGRPAPDRTGAARAWARRRRLGKVLNLMRLVKAAATYRGGIAYALAKVERHSGQAVALRPWERRWPLLAAPLVLWRLWRQGRLR